MKQTLKQIILINGDTFLGYKSQRFVCKKKRDFKVGAIGISQKF